MANYSETLLVPTNADNERMEQRFHQNRDSAGKWPVYPDSVPEVGDDFSPVL